MSDTPPPPVRLLFFSVLRDIVGAEEVSWNLPREGLSIAETLEAIYETWPKLREWDARLLIAINLEFAQRDQLILPGHEVAFMPPVQGG